LQVWRECKPLRTLFKITSGVIYGGHSKTHEQDPRNTIPSITTTTTATATTTATVTKTTPAKIPPETSENVFF